jgi:hypothetical protein
MPLNIFRNLALELETEEAPPLRVVQEEPQLEQKN